MSTLAMLHELERAGSLVRFVPRLHPHEAELRHISMLPSLHRWVHQHATKRAQIDYLANVRAHLGDFVKGALIDDEDYMTELKRNRRPSGVWEFRVRRFTPQCRILCAFAVPNWVVATHPRDRGELDNEGAWAAAIARVEREWQTLFPGFRWFTGQRFSDYVTSNTEERRAF
jgi:hypothetical protein